MAPLGTGGSPVWEIAAGRLVLCTDGRSYCQKALARWHCLIRGWEVRAGAKSTSQRDAARSAGVPRRGTGLVARAWTGMSWLAAGLPPCSGSAGTLRCQLLQPKGKNNIGIGFWSHSCALTQPEEKIQSHSIAYGSLLTISAMKVSQNIGLQGKSRHWKRGCGVHRAFLHRLNV